MSGWALIELLVDLRDIGLYGAWSRKEFHLVRGVFSVDIFPSSSRQDLFVAHVAELQLCEQIDHSADYMNVQPLHILEVVVVCHDFVTQ
jgi:hypothetical protein